MEHIRYFDTIENFTTARLHAHKINDDDIHHLTILRTSTAPDEVIAWLDASITQWHEYRYGPWLFLHKENHTLIGVGGLRQIRFSDKQEMEVYCELMPHLNDRGYMEEIIHACKEIAFEVLRLNHIVSLAEDINLLQGKMLEKVGFNHQTDILFNNHPYKLYELNSYRKAEVLGYNPSWPQHFQTEAQRMHSKFGDELCEIQHIGSTSIPDMPAKPIIDMLLIFADLSDLSSIKEKLRQLDYPYTRRHVVPHHTAFTNRHHDKISFNVHIAERGNPQIKRHILFRDYLRIHHDYAKQYADLKLKLSSEHLHDINTYVIRKDKLVQEIDRNAKLWQNSPTSFLSANKSRNAHTSKDILIKAMEVNLNEHMTYFAQYLNQVELIRIPGYTLVNSDLYDDTFNYVLDADFTRANAMSSIKSITEYFRQRGIPFSWWLSPGDEPDNLPDYLEKCGYTNTENNTAMFFDLDNWKGEYTKPAGLDIRRALDKQSLQDFAMVLTNDANSFSTYYEWLSDIITEDDPIELYVGYVDNKPVVRGQISFFGGIAGLHCLSTSPDARRKGYGTAMQQYRLQRAKQLGYHLAALQASPEGYPLYKKLGYQECGVFREYKLK